MDPATLLLLTLVLAAAGLAAGTLAGLLGVGGGIVIVPVLYHMFSFLGIDPAVRMHVAVGTSLATIIPTSLSSLRAHVSRGSFDSGLFRFWAPGMFVGAAAGSILAAASDFRILLAVFALVAAFVALQMGLARPLVAVAGHPPGRTAAAGLSGITGGVSAMMGIGGGTLAVPLLSWCGVPIHRAVGTSAGFGFVIAVPATIGFILGGLESPALPPFSLGYVNWLGLLVIVPATVLMAPFGTHLAHRLNQLALRRAFAVFLGITAARMMVDIVRT